MGNILKDSLGKVLLTNNDKAFEISSSIDSNITPENIKKDVSILGVTGTYEGSGGFRCTNKLMNSTSPPTFYNRNESHQYTFDGEIASAGIAILDTLDLMNCYFRTISPNASSVNMGGYTLTPGTLVFLDRFNDSHFNTYENNIIVSQSLHMTNSYFMDITISIDNNGLLSFVNSGSTTVDSYHIVFIVIFKSTDGTYDYDIINCILTDND